MTLLAYKMENEFEIDQQLSFQTLFQALPGHYLVLSPGLHIIAVTDSYLSATLADRSSILGKYVFDVFPDNPHDSESKSSKDLHDSLKYVLEHKKAHQMPVTRYDVPRPESLGGGFEKRYWRPYNTPVLNKDGTLSYIIHEVHNVTEQVQSEQNMEHALHNLQLISEAIGGVAWECDMQADILIWSRSYKNTFGYTDADLVTNAGGWLKNVHPDDYSTTEASLETAIKNSQKSWQGEYRYRKADGSYANVLGHAYFIYDSSSLKPVRIMGSAFDITRQRQHEQELQHSIERFKRIAMATSDVIWDWNLQDDSIWWNEGYKTLFGYKEHDSSISSWTDYIHSDDLARVKASINKAISDKSVWQDEYRFRCADGTYKLIQDKGYVIINGSGQPVRMFGSMQDVTEKRLIEKQLEESYAHTRHILESLPLMTWTTNADGAATYYNQRWYDYTGSSFEEIKEHGWKKSVHPDDLEKTTQLWQESVATGNKFEVENRWKCAADGTYRWFLARAVPIRNSEGAITMWVGSHTDIEDQKQIMLALQDSKDKLQYLTESSPQVVWSANPDGNIDFTSKQWYEYTQMTIEESLGDGWAPAIHPDDLQYLIDSWTNSITTGEPYNVEVRVRDVKTDIYQWFLIKAQPLHNEQGQIIKWYGTGVNINDQKVLQQQLAESEKQFRFLAESIPQMVWTTRPDGYHDYFNQRWMDYTGLTLEESMGQVWNDMLHPDDRKRARDRWEYSLRTGDYYEIEYRFKNGFNGTYRWFLGQAMAMRNAEGSIIKWFGTLTDIEDHKKAEEELLEKNLELERTNQDLDSFVYTASHDLKLPIVNMAGLFKELTKVAEFKDPEATNMIAMFERSLQQIHTTINDLSDVVKVQKVKDKDQELIDLNQLAEDVKISLQDVLQNTNATIITDFAEVPAIAFSKSSLKSIFYNLLSNSIKYRDQSRAPEVRISTTRKGDFVELKVQDNGIGIDMNKHQNKLFQMFKRFHNHVSGSGLGLYIVNRLLTNSGGYINIESTLNQGTTFLLYFKQKKA